MTLFENEQFRDFSAHTFSYAPPAGCPGPWRKVVFTGDFTVSKGRQFDRTASFYVGRANIYYGTTAEPRKTLSPSWHVERDLTDLSAVFETEQSGKADLGNFVGTSGGVDYTGIIYVTARLEFYPTCSVEPAPRTPDLVIPVNGPGGDAGTLNTSTDQITETVNLPRNIERAYLDVIAQSQSNDEFWYLCVPDDQASNLQSCPNTGFRETEVYLDGKLAGVAPISPWIYTGGIDPYLWEPITGVQTLNFRPYRVDLTPFAGVLSDGRKHTVAVSVYNANSYFLATGNLLLYTDHWSPVIHGDVTRNTLTMPSPVVVENISGTSEYTGNVDIASERGYEIAGFIQTSHGRVNTALNTTIAFSSRQTFDVSATKDIQNLSLMTRARSRTVRSAGIETEVTTDSFWFPLRVEYSYVVNADQSSTQTTKIRQANAIQHSANGRLLSSSMERVFSADTLNFSASGPLSGPPVGESEASFASRDAQGNCFDEWLESKNQKVTAVTRNTHCH